jgi:hypothetical protein
LNFFASEEHQVGGVFVDYNKIDGDVEACEFLAQFCTGKALSDCRQGLFPRGDFGQG